MDVILLVDRVILAGVFGLAALLKEFDKEGTRKAVEGFGIPGRIVRPTSALVPLAELGVAAALLPRSSARYGAIGAMGILFIFTAAMVASLVAGRTPECHCFGQISTRPIGVRTLARNAFLFLAAGFLVLRGWSQPGPSAVQWVSRLSVESSVLIAVLIVAAGSVGVMATVVVSLLRQQGRLLLRVEALEGRTGLFHQTPPMPGSNQQEPAVVQHSTAGLGVGSLAPSFTLLDLSGQEVSLARLLLAEKPLLLVFYDPGCGPCHSLLPDIEQWERDSGISFKTVILSRGNSKDSIEKLHGRRLGTVLVDIEHVVSSAYEAYGTPSAVLISPGGSIAGPIAQGADEIRRLAHEIEPSLVLMGSVSGVAPS